MKYRQKILASLGTLALLSSCDQPSHLDGMLKLTAPLAVTDTDGRPAVIPAGTYKTDADVDPPNVIGGAVTVTVHAKKGDVAFTVPKISPDSSGAVSLSAGQVGQSFGLQGRLTQDTRSVSRTQSEQCVSGSHTDCSWLDSSDPNTPDQYICSDHNDYGTQQVHEIGQETLRVYSLNLVAGGKTIGAYRGQYASAHKYSTYDPVSDCQ